MPVSFAIWHFRNQSPAGTSMPVQFAICHFPFSSSALSTTRVSLWPLLPIWCRSRSLRCLRAWLSTFILAWMRDTDEMWLSFILLWSVSLIKGDFYLVINVWRRSRRISILIWSVTQIKGDFHSVMKYDTNQGWLAFYYERVLQMKSDFHFVMKCDTNQGWLVFCYKVWHKSWVTCILLWICDADKWVIFILLWSDTKSKPLLQRNWKCFIMSIDRHYDQALTLQISEWKVDFRSRVGHNNIYI